MAKDHAPSGFERPSGYVSDLERSETDASASRINTGFSNGQHKVIVEHESGTHEHYFYNPQSGVSGHHGENYATRHNHPQPIKEESSMLGGYKTFSELTPKEQKALQEKQSRVAAEWRTRNTDENGNPVRSENPDALQRELTRDADTRERETGSSRAVPMHNPDGTVKSGAQNAHTASAAAGHEAGNNGHDGGSNGHGGDGGDGSGGGGGSGGHGGGGGDGSGGGGGSGGHGGGGSGGSGGHGGSGGGGH